MVAPLRLAIRFLLGVTVIANAVALAATGATSGDEQAWSP
jgi:hypothetical protein